MAAVVASVAHHLDGSPIAARVMAAFFLPVLLDGSPAFHTEYV
jgi:hypothetical protein